MSANPTSVTSLLALLVCLAPTTIGALLSAIGIAGMSRLNQANEMCIRDRSSTANFVSGLMKSIPPMNEIFEMAGMQLPEFLGKKIGPETKGEKAILVEKEPGTEAVRKPAEAVDAVEVKPADAKPKPEQKK